ncbi:MAG: Deoxyribodipyrimidine photo-lyase [Chloroflexi bacterium ADurb.Bin360]|nr:MAG: Deoxyribodipyrimidine photo-lyase [Chloroflexi bacterium ADurb.Bin360]
MSDNQTLTAALRNAEQVLPVFILDPALLCSLYMSERRLAFLLGGLRALDEDLRSRGSKLIVREGRPAEELAKLQTETGAEAVFAEADVSPYARRRDEEVASQLTLRLHGGVTIMPPEAVHRQDGAPYTVFTPFSRTWKTLSQPTLAELEPAPARIPTPPGVAGMHLESEVLKRVNFVASEFPPGETEAQRRLERFMERALCAYATDRDRMDLDGTSRLSPYLRFGMLSARQAAATAIGARRQFRRCDDVRGAETWFNEILWREFYSTILYHFPHVRRGSFRREFNAIPWRNDPEEFRAWQEGRTGYPVVDAAMRQLRATGWMHNRARMIVASFLTKDLLIDWRWGERYFMEQLLDGDPASNNGGWQWAAGTGTDAAPYFRIFNPVLQGERFDPEGAYIRRWVPELQRAPAAVTHRPWTMPEPMQREIGCMIGVDYPAPVVDHSMARERTLAAYKAAKG